MIKPSKLILVLILAIVFIVVVQGVVTKETVGDKVSGKPKFKYLFFREDCFEEFTSFNFAYKDCISITLSKFFGYLIILAATAVKLPQIMRIIKAKSGKGVLPSTFFAECVMYIIKGCYAAHLGSSFSVYGENLFMFLQSFLIINLLWDYDKESKIISRIATYLVLFSLFGVLYTDIYLNESAWKVLINLQIIFSLYSRLPQIWFNFSQKSTGQLSFTSFFMNALGNFVRLLTVLKEIKDPFYILASVISFTMNATICIQIKMYRSKEKVKDDSEVDNKKDSSKAKKHTSNGKNGKNGNSKPYKRANKTT
ncbi:unnamed protein product [Moneuplotes crassus]|uniref:Mannose-P-dolichol utilization defect 1 protein homolog n=1 Tax=Euplotes crassus TaxID=5936 RepID=A0AAD1XMX9_EUPCR|nr:unnamed protein product [Moneuplotes crassus]